MRSFHCPQIEPLTTIRCPSLISRNRYDVFRPSAIIAGSPKGSVRSDETSALICCAGGLVQHVWLRRLLWLRKGHGTIRLDVGLLTARRLYSERAVGVEDGEVHRTGAFEVFEGAMCFVIPVDVDVEALVSWMEISISETWVVGIGDYGEWGGADGQRDQGRAFSFTSVEIKSVSLGV